MEHQLTLAHKHRNLLTEAPLESRKHYRQLIKSHLGVLRPLQPVVLTLGFALFATGRLRAVALVTQITMIGTIEFFAAKAFATPHWGELKN